MGLQLNFRGLNKAEAVNMNYAVFGVLAVIRREISEQTLEGSVSMRSEHLKTWGEVWEN